MKSMREAPLPAGWKRRGARPPKPPVHVSPAWELHDQPPRYIHIATGFRVALYERGIEAGGAIELAAVKLPATDVEQLRALCSKWLEKERADRERRERREAERAA